MRPNSLLTIMSVSSRSPRCFKSDTNVAIAGSADRASMRCARISSWLSHGLFNTPGALPAPGLTDNQPPPLLVEALAEKFKAPPELEIETVWEPVYGR